MWLIKGFRLPTFMSAATRWTLNYIWVLDREGPSAKGCNGVCRQYTSHIFIQCWLLQWRRPQTAYGPATSTGHLHWCLACMMMCPPCRSLLKWRPWWLLPLTMHVERSEISWATVRGQCWCVFVSFFSLQLDAQWSVVVKMARRHLTRWLTQPRVRWPCFLGMGLFYLLLVMLSTCLGQDTEGKGILWLWGLLFFFWSQS